MVGGKAGTTAGPMAAMKVVEMAAMTVDTKAGLLAGREVAVMAALLDG